MKIVFWWTVTTHPRLREIQKAIDLPFVPDVGERVSFAIEAGGDEANFVVRNRSYWFDKYGSKIDLFFEPTSGGFGGNPAPKQLSAKEADAWADELIRLYSFEAF